MDLFYRVEKCLKEELIRLMIAGLQKSVLKIGLFRFHQLLQSANGTTLDIRNMEVASLSDHAKYKKHKGKDHDFNNSKSSMSWLFSLFLIGCPQVQLYLVPLNPVRFKAQ